MLANNIPAELICDRIILIGSIADSTSDLSFTPYSRWQTGKQIYMTMQSIKELCQEF